jgi:hypothetical protein
MVHARPIVGEVAAGVRQHHLQPGIALHHAVEDEVARGHGGLERIADHVVEIVVGQALAVGEADRVHEDHHVELLRLGEKALKVQLLIRQIHAVHAGIDLDAAQAEVFHGMLELAYGERGIL